MPTRGSKKKSAAQSRSKPVIEHDPLDLGEEGPEASAEGVAVQTKASAPTKKVAKKKAVRKKVVRKKAAAQKQQAEKVEEQAMAAPNEDETESSSYDLGGSLTIIEVADIHQQLAELLEKGQAVSLVGSDVENVDGAGLQLLAAFVKDAGQRDIKVSWVGVSDTVREASEQVGLLASLNLSEASE